MDIVQSLAGFLVETSARATLLLVVACVSARLLSRSSSSVRHRLWSLTMLSLILLPVASCALPSCAIPILPAVQEIEVAAPDHVEIPSSSTLPRTESSVPNENTAVAHSLPQSNADGSEEMASREAGKTLLVSEHPSERPPLDQAARPGVMPEVSHTSWTALSTVVIWSLGAGLLAILIVVNVARTIRFCRRSMPILDGVWCRLLTELSQRLRLRRIVTLREHTEPIVPLTCGVLRPVVLLPPIAHDWDEPMQRTVLTHELAHVKRRDVVFQFVGRLACTVYWFHPLAWYALRKLRQEGEQACDDAVVHSGEKASDYAAQLLRVAELCCAPRGLSHGVAMAAGSNLELRIQSLFDSARRHEPVRKIVSVAMLLVSTLTLGMTAVVHPVAATEQAPPKVQIPADTSKPAADAGVEESNPIDAAATQAVTSTPSKVDATPPPSEPKADTSKIDLKSVIWWKKVKGLQAGFLLDSPGLPNRSMPFDSVVKFRVLVRNTTDKHITFMARPVPHDYRDAPYLIPSDDITNALDAPDLPDKFRATDGRQGWKYDLAYEMRLGPGESTIIPAHRGGDEIGLYVGDGDGKGLPTIRKVKAGMNWIVQPLQIWVSTEPEYGTGVLFEGLYFQTRIDRAGNAKREPATRSDGGKGGTVLHPRIQLEVGTLNAAATRNAKNAIWGKVDKGLQCGIRPVNPQPFYITGDTLEAEVLWRNTSDKTIATPIPRKLDLYPMVHDAKDKYRIIDFGARFNLFAVSEEIAPGAIRSLGVFQVRLVARGTASPKSNAEPAHITLAPGVYKLSAFGGVSAPDGGNPRSGRFEFQIAAIRPNADAELEQKQKAAYGRIEALGGEVTPYDETTVGINLWKTKATDEDLEMLKCFSPVLIELTGTQITDAGLVHFQGMKRLSELDLHATRVTDAGLANLGKLTGLARIGLSDTSVTSDGLKHLKPLKSLYMLSLNRTKITDAGLAHLSDLPKIRTLVFDRTAITDAGLAHLSNLKSLHDIRLGSTQITDKGLEHLSRMPELQTVELSGTKVTGLGLSHLPPSVKTLWLPSTQLDDDGLNQIAHLKNLESLVLSNTKITDKGLQKLEKLSNLRKLQIGLTKVTDAGVKRLKAALPDCQVHR